MNEEVNETPHVSWLRLWWWNWQGILMACEHWLLTHVHGLHFCYSCSGYFREAGMALPDKCEACYARDYGLEVRI